MFKCFLKNQPKKNKYKDAA